MNGEHALSSSLLVMSLVKHLINTAHMYSRGRQSYDIVSQIARINIPSGKQM